MTQKYIPPLLSVIIPTKDRYKYLKVLIETISSFQNSDIEVVIQDNTFENAEIEEFLAVLTPFQTKYFHNSSPMSIGENVDLAINNSTGKYVCFIGDDDAVLPNIVNCVKWMDKHGIEAVKTAYIKYNWPDCLTGNSAEQAGSIYGEKYSLKVNSIDPIDSLRKLAKNGFSNVDSIPKLYQGIVRRDILDKIWSICSTYTPGPSPDMACAVALSILVKKFVVLNIPVIIIGQSKHLGGGERALNGGVKRISDVDFLPKNSERNWDKNLPKVWCSETVWPESALKAIDKMGARKLLKVNYIAIYAKFLYAHPKEYKEVPNLSTQSVRVFLYLLYLYFGRKFNKYILQSGSNKLLAKTGRYEVCEILLLDTMEDAINFLLVKLRHYMEESIFDEIEFFE